jgi:hypothetical protein
MMAAACGDKKILSLSCNPGAAVTACTAWALPISKSSSMTQVLPEEMTLLLRRITKRPAPNSGSSKAGSSSRTDRSSPGSTASGQRRGVLF